MTIYQIVRGRETLVPVFLEAICAGFPSPAEDLIEDAIDLDRLLVENPPATFLWRVKGDSMIEAGIFDGDIVAVDRSLDPVHEDVVVAVVNGEASLKRFLRQDGGTQLAFANARFPAYRVPDIADVTIWGVVTWGLHPLRKGRGRR